MIHILPPRPPEGRGFGKRLAHGLPDLALGTMFAAAWLDLFGLGGRYGIDLMLLVEIEGWILIVTLLSVGAAYGFATETEWKDKAKSMTVLVLLCAVPPVYFALRWNSWWPVAAYGALLWNRVRLARAGREGARHLRAPLREVVLYGAAAAASVWFKIPALGAADAISESRTIPAGAMHRSGCCPTTCSRTGGWSAGASSRTAPSPRAACITRPSDCSRSGTARTSCRSCGAGCGGSRKTERTHLVAPLKPL